MTTSIKGDLAMTLQLKEWLEQKAPWLVKNFNGATWEDKQEVHERRIRALEQNNHELWGEVFRLYSELYAHTIPAPDEEKHKPQPERIPAPDEEN